jgi:hypothetical protein
VGDATVAGRDCRWIRSRPHNGAHEAGHRDRYVARHNRSADLYRPHNGTADGCTGSHDGCGSHRHRSGSRSLDRRARNPAAPAGNHLCGRSDGTTRCVLHSLGRNADQALLHNGYHKSAVLGVDRSVG